MSKKKIIKKNIKEVSRDTVSERYAAEMKVAEAILPIIHSEENKVLKQRIRELEEENYQLKSRLDHATNLANAIKTVSDTIIQI